MSPPVAASTSALPATHSAAHPPEAGEVLSTVAVATRMSTTGSTGAELASPSSVLPVVKGGTPAAVDARKNLLPSWESSSGGIPGPLSAMDRRQVLPSGSRATRTTAPSGLNLQALERRFAIARSSSTIRRLYRGFSARSAATSG